MKTVRIYFVGIGFLAGLGIGIILGAMVASSEPQNGVVQANEVAGYTIPTLAPEAVKTPAVESPAEVKITASAEITYMYRLDEFGHAIWQVVGEIPENTLVKRSPCLADGYAQVEYKSDPNRPNSWKVEFVKCSP